MNVGVRMEVKSRPDGRLWRVGKRPLLELESALHSWMSDHTTH